MPRKKTVTEEKDETVTEPSAEAEGPKSGIDSKATKLDSIDFYRTQLKLEGIQSEISKNEKEAIEINRQILEISQDGDGSAADAEAEKLARAQEHIQALHRRLENTKLERDVLNQEVSQLRSDLARTYHDDRSVSGRGGDSFIGTITRTSDDTFSSSLFHDGRYEVRLARDGSYVKFRPNVEGAAVCSTGTIRIPLLPTYVPFGGPREYGVIPIDGKTLMIRL